MVLNGYQIKGSKSLELDARPVMIITGFEEFYAEPPMRREEAEEEELLYDPALSVTEFVSLISLFTLRKHCFLGGGRD